MRKIKNRIELLSTEDFKQFIDANTEVLIIAPWNGKPVPVCIQILDSVALNACGSFNSVTTIVKDENKEPGLDDIIKTKNIHESLLKLALVSPTFEEIETHLMSKDFCKQKKKEIKDIEELIMSLTSEVEKTELSQELERLELAISFLIPEDFTLTIINVLMQKGATDINKLTRDTLLEAGLLGEKYNTRPSEYIGGTFTTKQQTDIDLTALMLVSDFREQQKVEKSGMRWIRGKNAS